MENPPEKKKEEEIFIKCDKNGIPLKRGDLLKCLGHNPKQWGVSEKDDK